LHALDIAARAGIAVPVPRPAYTVAALEHPQRVALITQSVNEIQARKPGTDYDNVDRP
jgi:hypothetical protein